ncbi:hypothetical protein ACPV3A_17345 [Paenibacillus sp. Dod16]
MELEAGVPLERPAVQVSGKSKQVHIQQKNRKETEVFLPVFDLFKDSMRL